MAVAGTRLTITLPDDLIEALQRDGRHLAVQAIVEEALWHQMGRLQRARPYRHEDPLYREILTLLGTAAISPLERIVTIVLIDQLQTGDLTDAVVDPLEMADLATRCGATKAQVVAAIQVLKQRGVIRQDTVERGNPSDAPRD